MAHSAKKWVRTVNTDSTHPPEGLFKKDPETIAKTLASKKVSSKAPGSGMRMLTYYVNRAGKELSATRRRNLEKAKELLSEKVRKVREKTRKNKDKA
jgi:tRNA(adenine34) deaminase